LAFIAMRKFMRSQWKKWQDGFRKQAPDLGVSVVEIDRKPLEAALTGVYELLVLDFAAKTSRRIHPKNAVIVTATGTRGKASS
jgi:Txe/YoeB family toxin of Txe-Axe toxin-antitoxin module